MINSLFPDSNYREQEVVAYIEEMQEMTEAKQTIPDWMCKVVDVLNEHAKQDQAEDMTNVLQDALNQILSYHQFDLPNLIRWIRKEILNSPKSEEPEIKEINSSAAKDLYLSLEDRIRIGKTKVFHYVPKTNIEKMGFASLSGMKELKETLNSEIIAPLKDPVRAKYNEEHYGLERPNVILLYGPPGTGKTTIVERLSVKSGLPLLEITRDRIESIYVGGSGLNLACAFDYAASIATEENPVILFIDDIDTILSSRNNSSAKDGSTKELGIVLDRLDDAQKNNIIVIVSTNKYHSNDKALLSRCRNQIYVGYLDEEGRKGFFKMKLNQLDNGKKLATDDDALNTIAKLTKDFSTRALEDFVTGAKKKAKIDMYHIRDIELKDFEEIISNSESQNKKENENQYKTNKTRNLIGFNKGC